MCPTAADYFATDEGQLIANAHRYITSARLLLATEEWKTRPTLLQTPVLHLLCHGIEVLMKFPLVRAGQSLDAVRRGYGHHLDRLWEADCNCILRDQVYLAADRAWATARDSGRWPEDDFSPNPRDEIIRAISMLSHLHVKVQGFRYTVASGTRTPRPPFLVDAFGHVAECTVMNPAYLDYPLSPPAA